MPAAGRSIFKMKRSLGCFIFFGGANFASCIKLQPNQDARIRRMADAGRNRMRILAASMGVEMLPDGGLISTSADDTSPPNSSRTADAQAPPQSSPSSAGGLPVCSTPSGECSECDEGVSSGSSWESPAFTSSDQVAGEQPQAEDDSSTFDASASTLLHLQQQQQQQQHACRKKSKNQKALESRMAKVADVFMVGLEEFKKYGDDSKRNFMLQALKGTCGVCNEEKFLGEFKNKIPGPEDRMKLQFQISEAQLERLKKTFTNKIVGHITKWPKIKSKFDIYELHSNFNQL